jgi:hypothetical protein
VGQDHPHLQTMLQEFMETIIFSYLVAAHILAVMTCMYLTLSMVRSQPQTQGTVPSPCVRHAGATIGISDTLVLNMDTVVWSLVSSVKGQTAISSEGLSVLVVEDSLVAFGGYNGHFNNQVHSLIPLYTFVFHDVGPRMCSESTE